jgi:hypothetical protein
MTPAEEFPEANIRLTPPGNMPDCSDLMAHRYSGEGEEGYISRWTPNDHERTLIAAGGDIWVFVCTGGAPPPIAITAVDPFEPLLKPATDEQIRMLAAAMRPEPADA